MTDDLRGIAAGEPPMPILPITSPWIEQISCPICYQLKIGAMVVHYGCMRLLYASCAQICLETSDKCGFCREQISDLPEDGLRLLMPTPNDNWMIDNTKFKCPTCKIEFKFQEAKTHPNSCSKSVRFKPPEHLFKWNEIEVVQRAAISNPIKTEPNKQTRDRLIVCHRNGQQLFSRMTPNNWDAPRIKLQIARLANIEANKVKLYKFYHEEVSDDATVRDIATGAGATHIVSLTTGNKDIEGLAESTAIISFCGAGPLPNPPKK